jgi:DNA-3-methyladenine glycosylase II
VGANRHAAWQAVAPIGLIGAVVVGTQGPADLGICVDAPGALSHHERRLDAEIAGQYGTGRSRPELSQAWRPYRTWAAVHLGALRGQRTGEIAGR